uniref:Transposase n=1 Tax=Macrostomum lignano TaxID=282301 RepID=A0A1I8FQI6_9PLAT
MPGRGKRRAGPGADLRGTRSRLEAERVKVNAQGFPVEHPFNKDNYRYTLAEPDLHAPGRQQWDQCESTPQGHRVSRRAAAAHTESGYDRVTLDCPAAQLIKSSRWIKFIRIVSNYEERDEVEKQEKSLRLLVGKRAPYQSGTKAAQVQANFGPEFSLPANRVADWLPMSNEFDEQAVEQCLAEIVE